jgi:cyclopropane fatty-acyl-phospholipid synthase-like methyltransferase
MDVTTPSIKSMKLYDQVERIYNELRARGIDDEAPLGVEDLIPFDQYHYHGTKAVDDAITALHLTSASKVLEVGSGIGGPARYIASKLGCRVTALELQEDLNATARDLTRRCGLQGLVEHIGGNILDDPFPASSFSALISLLVFLHIPKRARLFTACLEVLEPGGTIYIEDFTKISEPSRADWRALEEKVYCNYLPTPEDYVEELHTAGFRDIETRDLTSSWKAFTTERAKAFQVTYARNAEIHGGQVAAGLADFYATVAALYVRGVLGGLRIIARKKL